MSRKYTWSPVHLTQFQQQVPELPDTRLLASSGPQASEQTETGGTELPSANRISRRRKEQNGWSQQELVKVWILESEAAELIPGSLGVSGMNSYTHTHDGPNSFEFRCRFPLVDSLSTPWFYWDLSEILATRQKLSWLNTFTTCVSFSLPPPSP